MTSQATIIKADRSLLKQLLRFIVGAGILLLAVGMALGLKSLGKRPDRKPQELTMPLVDVIDVTPRRVRFDVASQGTVEPLTQTTLAAEVAGAIVAMSDQFIAGGTFAEGDYDGNGWRDLAVGIPSWSAGDGGADEGAVQVLLSGPFFADGFETGDATGWSSVVP